MGTLKRFPNPAMVRGEQSSPAPHATGKEDRGRASARRALRYLAAKPSRRVSKPAGYLTGTLPHEENYCLKYGASPMFWSLMALATRPASASAPGRLVWVWSVPPAWYAVSTCVLVIPRPSYQAVERAVRSM